MAALCQLIKAQGSDRSQHFTVAARYVPMTAVAGDFYEFLSTGVSAN